MILSAIYGASLGIAGSIIVSLALHPAIPWNVVIGFLLGFGSSGLGMQIGKIADRR